MIRHCDGPDTDRLRVDGPGLRSALREGDGELPQEPRALREPRLEELQVAGDALEPLAVSKVPLAGRELREAPHDRRDEFRAPVSVLLEPLEDRLPHLDVPERVLEVESSVFGRLRLLGLDGAGVGLARVRVRLV
jgi:hypothetical protein